MIARESEDPGRNQMFTNRSSMFCTSEDVCNKAKTGEHCDKKRQTPLFQMITIFSLVTNLELL